MQWGTPHSEPKPQASQPEADVSHSIAPTLLLLTICIDVDSGIINEFPPTSEMGTIFVSHGILIGRVLGVARNAIVSIFKTSCPNETTRWHVVVVGETH